jgi:hypothetical protein
MILVMYQKCWFPLLMDVEENITLKSLKKE